MIKTLRTLKCVMLLSLTVWTCLGISQAPPPITQLLPEADAGDAEAQFQLGLLFSKGSLNTPKDQTKAFGWFRRSAAAGNAKGENALGIAYVHGYGIAEDPATGFGWFYKAALQGNPAAQHNLAALYQSGNGTLKNEGAAFDWSLKAALNGETSSQLLLCSRYQQVSSNERDLTMAYAWCLISQDSGGRLGESRAHYSEKQSEILKTYSARAKEQLSPAELEEATTLARTWISGHGSGVTLPRHSLHALSSGSAPQFAAEDNIASARQPKYVRSNGCETGHWVDSVLRDGAIIKLEDGTIWKVDDTDTVDSSLWLDTEDITVCDGKLVNTDDKTSVGAHKVR